VIGIAFNFADALGVGCVIVPNRIERQPEPFNSLARHLSGELVRLRQRNDGRSEQTVVQLDAFFGLLAVRHQLIRQLLQQRGHRQQQRGAENVEHRMRDGDAEVSRRSVQQRRPEDGGKDAERRQPDGGADDVEGQMNDSGTPCIFVGADGGKQRRHAGADVLPHNDRHGRSIGDRARRGKRLQNPHRGRAGLNNAGEHRADEHA